MTNGQSSTYTKYNSVSFRTLFIIILLLHTNIHILWTSYGVKCHFNGRIIRRVHSMTDILSSVPSRCNSFVMGIWGKYYFLAYLLQSCIQTVLLPFMSGHKGKSAGAAASVLLYMMLSLLKTVPVLRKQKAPVVDVVWRTRHPHLQTQDGTLHARHSSFTARQSWKKGTGWLLMGDFILLMYSRLCCYSS